MKLCLVFLIALSIPVRAIANDECSVILRDLLKNTMVSESALLQAFDVQGDVHIESLLGDRGNVYLLRTPSGRYIVRFGGVTTDVAREAFGINFGRGSPLKTFPNVRALSPSDTQILKTKLKPKQEGKFGWFIEKSQTASVSVFYDAEKGSTYIDRRLYATELDRELYEATTEARRAKKPEDLKRIKDGIAEMWQSATPQEQMRFSFEMKQLFPELMDKPVEEAFFHFYRNFSPDLLESLEVLRYNRIPASVRRQLADSWLLYTALDIPDFHQGNWLLSGDKVLPLDLGYPPELKTGLRVETRWQPYNMRWMTPKSFQHVLQNASPEMLHYLESIQAKDLTRMATQASYKLREGETAHILSQIQELLAEAKRVRPPKP